jgi:hypothetical protein
LLAAADDDILSAVLGRADTGAVWSARSFSVRGCSRKFLLAAADHEAIPGLSGPYCLGAYMHMKGQVVRLAWLC